MHLPITIAALVAQVFVPKESSDDDRISIGKTNLKWPDYDPTTIFGSAVHRMAHAFVNH